MAGPCCGSKTVVANGTKYANEATTMEAMEGVAGQSHCCENENTTNEVSTSKGVEHSSGYTRKPVPDCADNCCASDDERSSSSHDHDDASAGDHCADGEKCDENCIQIAAAVECQLACEKPAAAEFGRGRDECCATTSSDTATGGMATHGHEYKDSNACISTTDFANKPIHAHEHDQNDNHDFNQPCSSHLQAAFDKYAAYLEQARCICRSVLPKQVDGGCGSSKPLLPPQKGKASSLVGSSTGVSHHSHTGNMTQRKFRNPHTGKVPSIHSHSSCCGAKQTQNDDKENCHDIHERPVDVDVEKGGQFSHVLLNVIGMDCTGCANNLARALSVPGTRNVQVVFVTGVAEFDVDLGKTSVAAVIAAGERATRYKLTPFSADSQVLDLIIPADHIGRFRLNLPLGVEECDKTGKNRYSVAYDPCLIGARSVLAASGGHLLAANDRKIDDGKRILVDKAIKTGLAFLLTIPVIILTWGEDNIGKSTATDALCFVLATLVQCIAFPEFYRPAISSLIYNRVVEMDMLVVISITAAYGYSVVAFGMELAGRELETGTLFETSTLLIALVLFGRLLASWARRRAIMAVSLGSLQSSTARLASGEDIDARLLHMGDVIKLQPHVKIVTDAIIQEGSGEVDESILTGESMPVHKKPGDTVIAATLNGSSLLTARVSRLPGKNTLNDIENLVNQAQNARPKTQQLADRVAGYFVPVVVAIAITVSIIWAVVAVKIRNENAEGAAGLSISYAIAVLAISCPCALGLAVPMVLVVAGGVAARSGIIIKSAEVTERGHKVTDVVFDKTGTLTLGVLEVVHREVMMEGMLGVIKALVSENQHPVSRAVAASITEAIATDVQDIISIPGAGVEATWNGKRIRAGKPDWLGVDHINASLARGLTPFCITSEHTLVAVFGLKSTLRPEAQQVVAELQRRNITVHIVSGDNISAVEHVALTLGIPRENIAAGKSPAEKRDYIVNLNNNNNNASTVDKKVTLFCGDGTNDAPAVAAADIGVQLDAPSSSPAGSSSSTAATASDITRATADVILLSNLHGIVKLLDISKAAYRRIIFNFVWSGVYNVVAVLLAGGAAVKVRVPPAYAGLGEVVSVLPVVLVAGSLAWGGRRRGGRGGE